MSSFIPSTSALQINIGFMPHGLGERVQIDYDNSGAKSPCYILIIYPAEWNDVPLLAIQKDIIMKMYQCVEQFHRPTVTRFTEANEWWRLGIARYMDGLSYPAKATTEFLTNGLYPEEYSWGLTLYQNDEAAALFWHFVDQLAGWTSTDVNQWMIGHANKATYDEERVSLAGDAKITSGLWHRFVLANIDGTVKYPGGQKIGNTNGGVPKRTHSNVVSVSAVGGTWRASVEIDSFKGKIWVFTFKAGQSFSLTVERIDGVEWSIRKVGSGSAGWNSGDRGRTVSVVVPAGGADGKWEIALSSTANGGGGEYPKVYVTRTA
ncbi:hypothetical protein V8F33_011783 [Rhypophila sp. PSN 637]